MKRFSRLLLLLVVAMAVRPVHAQETLEIPRTRTLPGVDTDAFLYDQSGIKKSSSEKLERLGDEITTWVANGDLVGAEILVVMEDQVVFHEAYGWSDREERRPMERNSIYHLGSMTKPVTAMAVLLLVQDGKLSLDDPVRQYIPDFAGDDRVTVRHLLSQTSGDDGEYGNGGFNIYDFDTLQAWVTDWAGHQPIGTFGEFRYSNFNYAALGYIVEQVSGKPFENFTHDRILEPLGMVDTHATFTPDAPWAMRTNSRYDWSEETGRYERIWSNKDKQPWSFYPAALGLWGTALDYARFVAAWLNKGQVASNRLLSEKAVDAALSAHGFLGEEAIYGYGWFLEESRDMDGRPLTFRHGGGDGTVAVAYPSDRAIVVYLSQSGRPPDHPAAFQNRIGMLGLFHHPGPWMEWADENKLQEVELSAEQRAAYPGRYRGIDPETDEPTGLLVTVFEENDRLIVRIGESGTLADEYFHLVPLGDDRFAYGRYGSEKVEGFDPVARIQFHTEAAEVKALESLADDETEFFAVRLHKRDGNNDDNR